MQNDDTAMTSDTANMKATGARDPPYALPKPAEVVLYDFRPAPEQRPSLPQERPVKLVQWNIERGYKLDAVIQVLRELDADVLALQEVDIHNERSGWEDTGRAIAQALGLSYAFVCEFEELYSPLRSPDSQGGGVHGNAILSKYDITDARAVEHSTHPVDWELAPERQPHALARKEPRHGRRLTAAATVHTHQGPLLVYSAHLECFCGALARMAQLSDLFQDTRLQQKRLLESQGQAPRKEAGAPSPAASPSASSSSSPAPPAPFLRSVIMGDLNTLGNGVARLSPNYCNDHLRWSSLGWFEAELLDRRVLDVRDPTPLNQWALRQGLPELTSRHLVNPGYQDPFDPRVDITFDHAKYRWMGYSFMTGKFDWVLLRGCRAVSHRMGNSDYSASDHKWLEVEVQLQ